MEGATVGGSADARLRLDCWHVAHTMSQVAEDSSYGAQSAAKIRDRLDPIAHFIRPCFRAEPRGLRCDGPVIRPNEGPYLPQRRCANRSEPYRDDSDARERRLESLWEVAF